MTSLVTVCGNSRLSLWARSRVYLEHPHTLLESLLSWWPEAGSCYLFDATLAQEESCTVTLQIRFLRRRWDRLEF